MNISLKNAFNYVQDELIMFLVIIFSFLLGFFFSFFIQYYLIENDQLVFLTTLSPTPMNLSY